MFIILRYPFCLGKECPKAPLQIFFLMFKLAVEKPERLIQVNSTFAVKPQFHTEQRPSLSQEHSGLSVPISHCCLCALSKGQTDFGRQHSAQQTAR